MHWLRGMTITESKKYGGKAYGLRRLYGLGVTIPNTMVIRSQDKLDADYLMSVLKFYGGIKFPLAVRSSAIGEDGKSASFAGQYLTLLNVTAEGLVDAIEQCRASGPQSDDYANAMQQDTTTKVNVLLQPMVEPAYAGVMFTSDPETKDLGTMAVEYVEGLGDKLVAGEVNPLQSLKIGGGNDFEVPDEIRQAIGAFRKYKPLLEKRYRCPVDVEWAIGPVSGRTNTGLVWLQARPITGVKWQKWYKSIVGQGITDSCVEGIVRRVSHKYDVSLLDGEILVTTMTNPNMVGHMLKASAIVTEIGGKLCHAAIVARELGKPCIVGCDFARKLKTGDHIRVDASKGTIEFI